jgi:hypothetical protein
MIIPKRCMIKCKFYKRRQKGNLSFRGLLSYCKKCGRLKEKGDKVK